MGTMKQVTMVIELTESTDCFDESLWAPRHNLQIWMDVVQTRL